MHPGFIPINEKPWRIICRNGSFLKDKKSKLSLRFTSAEAALKHLAKLKDK